MASQYYKRLPAFFCPPPLKTLSEPTLLWFLRVRLNQIFDATFFGFIFLDQNLGQGLTFFCFFLADDNPSSRCVRYLSAKKKIFFYPYDGRQLKYNFNFIRSNVLLCVIN